MKETQHKIAGTQQGKNPSTPKRTPKTVPGQENWDNYQPKSWKGQECPCPCRGGGGGGDESGGAAA